MSYQQLIQNYIDASWRTPPNLADPCNCCSQVILPTCNPCNPGTAVVSGYTVPGPCIPMDPCCAPCAPPCGRVCETRCKTKCEKNRCKKSKCKCRKKSKCKCKKKSKCCETFCESCVEISIEPYVSECIPCCPPPPPPATPCDQPWVNGWPWITQSWFGQYYS